MAKHFLQKTLHSLDKVSQKLKGTKAFVGLDGYIDLIQRAVKVRKSSGPEYFETITDFAAHLQKAAGKSGQVELVTQEKKLGGNAPIMAHALGSIGFPTTCIGNFGENEIDDVFKAIHENVTMLSIGSPAMTNALEFDDGKLILSEVGPFKNQDWNFIKNKVDIDALINQIKDCRLIALVDWCNLPYSTDTWNGILHDVLPHIPPADRHFFFDIADPAGRTYSEIAEALKTIGQYSRFGKVTLGLNENETEKLFDCLARLSNETEQPAHSLVDKAKYIYSRIEVWNLLVHPTNRSISIQGEKVTELPGRVVAKPKISTGGGDNFNAGYCLGQIMGFDMEECMITAMATSGAYVQDGQSPAIADLQEYIKNWHREIEVL